MNIKSITLSILLAGTMYSQAQETKPTIAIANPNVNGLFTKVESVAKMMRLEFVKMDQHLVLDEFDMSDVLKANPEFQSNCLGKDCLAKLGKSLKVDYIACGSFDDLSNKIVITVKIIDVKNETIFKSAVREFDDQEVELQRMIEIVLKEMYAIPVQKETAERLAFKNEPITSNNVGRIKNSGPRIGYAYLLGSMNEFARRPESQGGLDIFPGVSMIGYQLEVQYVGTENFAALVEFLPNISGLEQGQFIPSVTIMNGFRFGRGGWEFAFGPGFSIRQASFGFFDTEGAFGDANRYYSEKDWGDYAQREFSEIPEYIDEYGNFNTPEPSQFVHTYNFDKKYADTRGKAELNTLFVFAIGRTFRSGALNIPVNIFYSSQKGGGMAGINIGFNVQKSKKPINKKNR